MYVCSAQMDSPIANLVQEGTSLRPDMTIQHDELHEDPKLAIQQTMQVGTYVSYCMAIQFLYVAFVHRPEGDFTCLVLFSAVGLFVRVDAIGLGGCFLFCYWFLRLIFWCVCVGFVLIELRSAPPPQQCRSGLTNVHL